MNLINSEQHQLNIKFQVLNVKQQLYSYTRVYFDHTQIEVAALSNHLSSMHVFIAGPGDLMLDSTKTDTTCFGGLWCVVNCLHFFSFFYVL